MSLSGEFQRARSIDVRVLPRLDEEHTGSALTDSARYKGRRRCQASPTTATTARYLRLRLQVRWLSTTCAVRLVLRAPRGLLWEPFGRCPFGDVVLTAR